MVRQLGRTIRIEGYLGDFRVRLGEPGDAGAETVEADLVLDLSPEPLIETALAPAGYHRAEAGEEGIAQAIDELASLIGTFEKPVYVAYDPSICAHGRSGHIACSRCIEACPAGAITGLAEAVAADTHLCQGGGVCATVCPSGAMKYAYPYARDTQEHLRLLLQNYRENGGADPVVVLFAAADGELADFSVDRFLPVMLEELASAGLETWLSALAYGARRLLLVDGGGAPAETMAALESQLEIAREILRALGYPAEAISRVPAGSWRDASAPLMPEFQPAGFYPLRDKRQSLYMSIDHLHAHAGRPKPVAPLPTGSPFGAAQVDEKRCTLCMSCVSACPGKALLHGQERPQLNFIESNCLQCGLCTRTCPEDAIWITPRLLFDRAARSKPRLLCEEPPFHCTVCGKPFATRSVIDSTLAKLRGHWMFQDARARNRLTMCETCRVVDAMQDPAAIDGDPKGQIHQ